MMFLFAKKKSAAGFTLVELVMIILLLSILSIAVYTKWPSGMDEEAAKLEFKQAIRYAQHMAMTRAWTNAGEAWGIKVSGNKYYVGRYDANCDSSCSSNRCAEAAYCDRNLLGSGSISLTPGADILFNGLGEPIDSSDNFLGNVTFTIGGSQQVTVCQQTGYVIEGGNCP